MTRSILVPIWVLAHLFLIDIDNQSLSVDEDRLNKPWRPLPSGRVTLYTVEFLSKALNMICLLVSWIIGGRELMIPSVIFCGLVYSYDHLLLNSHYIWKNVINGFGYAVLETGATTVLSDLFNFHSSSSVIYANNILDARSWITPSPAQCHASTGIVMGGYLHNCSCTRLSRR